MCHLNGLALMTGLRMGHTQSPPSCLFLFADVLEVKKIRLKKRTFEENPSKVRNEDFPPALFPAYFMLLENCIISDKLR